MQKERKIGIEKRNIKNKTKDRTNGNEKNRKKKPQFRRIWNLGCKQRGRTSGALAGTEHSAFFANCCTVALNFCVPSIIKATGLSPHHSIALRFQLNR
jgi:hypothetical protein